MDDHELVFYKDSEGKIMSGGYVINSSFLTNDSQVMTTMNGGNPINDSISQVFDTLAIPAGLFYINYQMKRGGSCGVCAKGGGQCGCDVSFNPETIKVEKHQTLNDDLHDKLMKMVEDDDEPIKKRKKLTKRSMGINKSNKRTKRIQSASAASKGSGKEKH